MAETNIKILKIEVDTGTGAIKVNGVTKSIKEATAATKEFIDSSSKMSKATKDLGSSAGLAGATVNELGRTISDLPYGITAITNNISQLGSLFAILVSKTGSVTNAFKSLFATLKASPALVALLAFQAVVAIIDVLAQKARKTEKAVKGLSQAVGESATELKIAREILNDSSASLERKESILSQVNEKYKDLKLSLDENGVATKESTTALDEQILSLERLAKSQAIVIEVQKIYGEMALLNTKTGAEAADFLDKTTAHFLNFGNTVQLITTVGIFGDRGNYFAKKIEELGEKTRQTLLGQQQKTATALIAQLKDLFPPKDPKDLSSKSLEDFNLLLIKSQIGYLASIDTNNQEYQVRLLNQTTDLKLKELDILKAAAVKKAIAEGRSNEELLILSTIYENKRQAILLDSNSKLMEIMKSFNKELKVEVMKMSDFTSEEQKDLNILNKIFGTDVKTAEDQLKDYSNKLIKGLADYQKRREDAERNGNEAVHKLRVDNINKAAGALDTLANLAEAAGGIMNAEFQKQMDLEQNKTTAINNQLKERLANEQLSANERRNIQLQISANDESLRIKQEAIAKKRFKTEKALRISVAIIDTASSALKAYASQLVVGDPSSIIRAQVAAGLATALGLAQVAMISKQQFVGSAICDYQGRS